MVRAQVRALLREPSGQLSPIHPPPAGLVADPQGVRGRIHVVTACEEYDRNMVWDVLRLVSCGEGSAWRGGLLGVESMCSRACS